MFRVGMVDAFDLQDQYVSREDVANYDKTIIPVAHPLIALAPHVDFKDKPSEIYASLVMSMLDRENAAFIINHAKEINEMLGTYSSIPVRFDSTISVDDVMKRDSLHIKCQINTKT